MAKVRKVRKQGAPGDAAAAAPAAPGASAASAAPGASAAPLSSGEGRAGAARGEAKSPRSPSSEPLRRAEKALARGNVRAARTLAAQILESGAEGDKAEARSILERSGPDPQSMLVAAAVLTAICLAIWAALLHAH